MTLKNKLLVIVAIAFQSSVAVAHPESGSPEAAVKVGSDLIQLLYSVGSSEIQAGTPSISDNVANLQIRAAGNVCDLTLLKNATANQFGWIVQFHTCKKLTAK